MLEISNGTADCPSQLYVQVNCFSYWSIGNPSFFRFPVIPPGSALLSLNPVGTVVSLMKDMKGEKTGLNWSLILYPQDQIHLSEARDASRMLNSSPVKSTNDQVDHPSLFVLKAFTPVWTKLAVATGCSQAGTMYVSHSLVEIFQHAVRLYKWLIMIDR